MMQFGNLDGAQNSQTFCLATAAQAGKVQLPHGICEVTWSALSGSRVGSIIKAEDVTNTGAVAGDAVVQIYIHQRYGIASRPVRHLKGFERIAVQPGGTRHSHSRWGRTK